MCSQALAFARRAVTNAHGAQNNVGSITKIRSGRQKICRSITGMLETAKESRWSSRRNRSGFPVPITGNETRQHHSAIPAGSSNRDTPLPLSRPDNMAAPSRPGPGARAPAAIPPFPPYICRHRCVPERNSIRKSGDANYSFRAIARIIRGGKINVRTGNRPGSPARRGHSPCCALRGA